MILMALSGAKPNARNTTPLEKKTIEIEMMEKFIKLFQ